MRVPLAEVEARRERLAKAVGRRQYASVAALCREFGVSEATLRRDLTALAGANRIVRTYGGALADYNREFASFDERAAENARAKERIAKAARALVKPKMTVFLDAGTTIHELARQLHTDGPQELRVVTNSIPTAETLGQSETMEVYLIGGRILQRQLVLLGREAERTAMAWSFDAVFLSAEGLENNKAWNSHEDVVRFQRLVMRRSTACYLCIDQSKFGVPGPIALAALEDFNRIFTDASQGQLADEGLKPPHVKRVK